MTAETRSGKYPIGTVSRVTGISTHTLRVWERRYGAVDPERTPGGSRVYSDADVDKLLLIKKLLDLGHSVGRVADLPSDELRRLLTAHEELAPAPAETAGLTEITRRRFLDALMALDISTAERHLVHTASLLAPRDLVLDVVQPIVDEIGRRWESGNLRIAHEHAASALLRNLLGTVLRSRPPERSAPTAVATTLAGELHEFGALMAALLATVHGWNTVYLGPNLPADEILHVVDRVGARALLLSLVSSRTPAFADELRALRAGLAPDVRLVAGGEHAPAYGELLAGATIIQELIELEPILLPS